LTGAEWLSLAERKGFMEDIDALDWAFIHVYHEDKSNAAMHCAPVKFSPITFRLAEALETAINDLPEVEEVLAHKGLYALDPGR
jgi:hypothetical protein